jgi:DNA-binding response OmpR family regulator
VILLDVMLPYSSGFDVCRDLRRRGIKTPAWKLFLMNSLAPLPGFPV